MEELGVEPGAQLQHLHRLIPMEGTARRPGTGLKGRPPATLAAAHAAFAGRHDQVELVADQLGTAAWEAAAPVAITGAAGIGKTATALHVRTGRARGAQSG
jgi:hypothetical protein